MKKAILLLVCVCLGFCVSCSRESQGKYIVSLIGLSREGKEFSVSVEAVTVHSEDSERDIENIVFKGKAKSISEAFSQAYNKSAAAFSLEHCAVIVLDETLETEDIRKMLIFCENRTELTRAVAFVRTKSTGELLKAKPFSSVALGFDIVQILATQHSEKKAEFKNRYYEIFESVLEKEGFNALPKFSVSDDKVYLEEDEANQRKTKL